MPSHLWMVKLKFMIANVTCAARQFCRINPLGPDIILKMTSSQYSEMPLAPLCLHHGQLDFMSNRLFRLTTKQTQKSHIPEFCENHLSPVVSPHKWVGNARIAIDSMTVTQHIVAQYGDINLPTLTQVMGCCLAEPNHYLNQFRLIIGKVQWGDTSAINYWM